MKTDMARFKLIPYPESKKFENEECCFPVETEDGNATFVPEPDGDWVLLGMPEAERFVLFHGTYAITNEDGFYGIMVPKEKLS